MNDQHILKRLATMLGEHFKAKMSVEVAGNAWCTGEIYTVTSITKDSPLGFFDDGTPRYSRSFETLEEFRNWIQEVRHAAV